MTEVEDKSAELSFLSQSISAITSSSENDEEEEKPNHIFLPINAVTNIFRFLNADELEIARQVCYTWKNVIDNNRAYLPYQDVDVLHISSNCEFVFALFCDNKIYRYTCQKFWTDYDTEMREKIQIYKGDEVLPYKYLCDQALLDPRPWTEHQHTSKRHIRKCTIRYPNIEKETPLSKCALYNPEKRIFYAKQLFTPPLIFYEKLRDMTMYTNIHTLVFNHFSVNETIGDMLKRWVGTLKVKRAFFHNLNLRAVSAKEFHYFITEAIHAEEYYFAYVHKALPDHFNYDLFMHPTMLGAKTISIGAIFDRSDFKNIVRCNFSEEDLSSFIYRQSPPGVLNTFRFNRDNFSHSETLLRNARLSVFKNLQSKHDPPVPF
uniref:F-box domain-containing protein n=1 Tax=Panagrolaimus superbus TaxID=310955 RepID=A0A914YGB5_9BILA